MNKISFQKVLNAACKPSQEWLIQNKDKGIRWMIEQLLARTEPWMLTQSFHASTNISHPCKKLREQYPEGNPIRDALEMLIIRAIDDGLTTFRVFSALDMCKIDDQFAD